VTELQPLKSTGVSRRVDRLGRVVLPAEMRRMFGIREGDLVEISVDGETMVLSKVEAGCVFCASPTALTEFAGRYVCSTCARAIARLGG
jgi:AbrB family transcriptional regulator, transcriptional pleiotropic regulator of transition state genes